MVPVPVLWKNTFDIGLAGRQYEFGSPERPVGRVQIPIEPEDLVPVSFSRTSLDCRRDYP